MSAFWIVERTENPRFPFRITIEQDGRTLLAVYAQNLWPGAGSQIFCLREKVAPEEELELVERVPIAHLTRLGKKLSVTLDRGIRKRCEFLKIDKPFKNKPGTYEQIFFRTELGVRAHRTSKRAELSTRVELDVVVDSAERYPWRFPGASVTKRKLPVGDYALVIDERIVAVVERKTHENFLGDVSAIKGLHQQLAELSSYPHAAVVVEAQYADFSNPKKTVHWPAAHLLRVIGELAALHPNAPVVFAGNRKMANVWTERFFVAVAAAQQQDVPLLVREPAARFEAPVSDGGVDTRIRIAALKELPDGFEIALLRKSVPDVSDERLRRVLNQLRKEGRLELVGRGRSARWTRVK